MTIFCLYWKGFPVAMTNFLIIKEKKVDQYSTRTGQKQYMKHLMSADILKHKQTFL